MVETSELLRVPAFADLPADQIAWFLSQSQELHVKSGDTYARQSDPADAMFVALDGQLEARGELGGETVVIPIKPGSVTGLLPFSRMKQFTVSGRAITDSRLLRQSSLRPAKTRASALRFFWPEISSAIGKEEIVPLEEAALPASERPPEPGPAIHSDDPQKERWGGQAERDGRILRAVLESVERDIFYFSLIVESTDRSELQPPVVFHLHDSYPRSIMTVGRIVDQRRAALNDWNAYGVFTVGAQVKNSAGTWISLEFDLATLPNLPERFLKR